MISTERLREMLVLAEALIDEARSRCEVPVDMRISPTIISKLIKDHLKLREEVEASREVFLAMKENWEGTSDVCMECGEGKRIIHEHQNRFGG